MSEWISVKDRLPENKMNVLCCGEKGGMFVGWFGFQTEKDKTDGKARAYVHGGNGRKATHWMPLPEPPEVNEKAVTSDD